MKVSGFTFIKNGISLGYPIRESVQSILPLCDEIVINVGFDDPECLNDDGTYEYLRDYFPGPKFHFLKSYWNPSLQKQGLILSQQTNIALEKCQGDLCQYIQGDEVIHEDDLSSLETGLKELNDRSDLEGLIFNYIHFYGNVDIYKYSRNIYRREVRTIKNRRNIISWLDAQGFRHKDESKIKAKLISARIFHYGWARKELIMEEKIQVMDQLYHEGESPTKTFTYSHIHGLKKFEGTHPAHMTNWVNTHKNDIDLLNMKKNKNLEDYNLAFSDWIEKLTGHRIGEYKNYILVK